MQRMAMVVGIKKEKIEEYKKLHANAWPEILDTLSNNHIKNYSIYLCESELLLFGYWEFHGKDFQQAMLNIAKDPCTQKWWTFTDPCQTKLSSAKENEQWIMMEEVFHLN